MKYKKFQKIYLTVKEKREYMLNNEPMPLSFDPRVKVKDKSNDRRYVTTLITGGDSSLIMRMKKGSRVFFSSSKYSGFGVVGKKEKHKSKVLSLFRK